MTMNIPSGGLSRGELQAGAREESAPLPGGVLRARRPHLHEVAANPGHLDSLGAAIVVGAVDGELDLLALAEAAETLGMDARLDWINPGC